MLNDSTGVSFSDMCHVLKSSEDHKTVAVAIAVSVTVCLAIFLIVILLIAFKFCKPTKPLTSEEESRQLNEQRNRVV